MPCRFSSEPSERRYAITSAAVKDGERSAVIGSSGRASEHPDCRFPLSAPMLSALETSQEGRRIPAAAAYLLHFLVELIDQRGDRQPRSVAVGLVEADAEVLAHPVDGEAEIVLACDHRLVPVLHLPGAGRALGDDLDHLFEVEPGLAAEMQTFR